MLRGEFRLPFGLRITKKTGRGAKDFRPYGLRGGEGGFFFMSLVRSSKAGVGACFESYGIVTDAYNPGRGFAYVQHMCWLERFHEF